VSRAPVTLETLALAISLLRQKGPHPNTANDLVIDVMPVLRAMHQAMAAIGEHARPDNWDDAEDPEQREAWLLFDSALAAFEAGRAPVTAPPSAGAGTWFPIQTAPKDGTRIEFFNALTKETDVGRWKDYSDRPEWMRDNWTAELRRDLGEWDTDHGNGDMTHWRPEQVS
jgi:hypothetical protein